MLGYKNFLYFTAVILKFKKKMFQKNVRKYFLSGFSLFLGLGLKSVPGSMYILSLLKKVPRVPECPSVLWVAECPSIWVPKCPSALSARVLKCPSSAQVPKCLEYLIAKALFLCPSAQMLFECHWGDLRVLLECPWSALWVLNWIENEDLLIVL